MPALPQARVLIHHRARLRRSFGYRVNRSLKDVSLSLRLSTAGLRVRTVDIRCALGAARCSERNQQVWWEGIHAATTAANSSA